MLAVGELREAEVDDLVHKLVDKDEIHSQQFLVDATAEVVDALQESECEITYVYDSLKQLERLSRAKIPLEATDYEVELLLLHVCKLNAIDLLRGGYI